MKTIEINAELRTAVGKKSSKVLRREEKIPCVLYGGSENIHFAAHENDFRHLIYTPNTYIVDLTVDGKAHKAIMKDIQFHPVTDKVIHIDFFQVTEDKAITIEVPVTLEGVAPGILSGGKLNIEKRKLNIKALLKDLPDTLTIDISGVKLGKTVKISDLSYDNVELLDTPNAVVCAVKLTRAARGAAAAGEEGEEGAATEAAAE